MPAGLQVQNFFSTALAGGGFEALTPGTGDSDTFFNVPMDSQAYVGQVWAVDDASPMELSLVASRFHDQQFAMRFSVPDGSTLAPASRSTLLTPEGVDQRIFPSDVLTVQVSGTAGDNVNVTVISYYSDIPGIKARLATWDYVRGNNKNQVGISTPITPGTGDWGATVALNAADNRLHANTDYAVLGFSSDIPVAVVALQGIDVGNLRVGGPVLADGDHDGQIFLDLARYWNAPLIPVINSNNAGNILVSGASPSGAAADLTVLLQELPAPFVG
jgi:hypothetical protein